MSFGLLQIDEHGNKKLLRSSVDGSALYWSGNQWMETGTGIGYYSGGSTGAAVATTDGLIFSTDTTAQVTKGVLSVAKYGSSGYNSLTIGYSSGGNSGAVVTTTDGLIFSTDTTAQVTKGVLSVAKDGAAGYNSTLVGYGSGGSTTGPVATTDGLTFSTDTTAQVTKGGLSAARDGYASMGGANSSTIGYTAGGATGAGGMTAVTDGLTFVTDTTAQTTRGSMTANTFGYGGANSFTVAYFSGGNTVWVSTKTAKTDCLIFATDTTAQVTKGVLSVATAAVAGSNGLTASYFSGGDTGANVTTTHGLSYATDTSAQVTKGSLTQARSSLTGFQSGGFV